MPEDHLAYFILEVVGELDLGAIERTITAKDPRGERPYAPQMMVALLLYGYCVGVFSSRRMARAAYEDVAFRVLAAESPSTSSGCTGLDHEPIALSLPKGRACTFASGPGW